MNGTGNGGRHAGARHAVPTALRPGSSGLRLDGLDAARGLAVLAMLVLHLGPAGGLPGVPQHVTAPLFAVVLGAAVGLSLGRPRVARVHVAADTVVRGLLLVLLGVALQAPAAHVDVVLPALGLVLVALGPLAVLLRPVPVLALGLVVAGAVLGPLVTERARDAVAAGAGTGVVSDLLDWTAADGTYRLVSLLPMALAGVVLALLLPRLTGPALAAAVSVVLLAAGGVVLALGAGTADGVAASSGTTAEVVAATFLASGAVVAAAGVVLARDARPRLRPVLAAVLSPVLALGRLALTAYTLLVLALALLGVTPDGATGGTWPVRLGTAVVVVVACWALDRRVGTGPLEALVRVARLPAPGRHGGPVSGRRSERGPGSPR